MSDRRTVACRHGFTIVELMMGMLAGAILALISGIILVEGFKVWTRNTMAAGIQRDGTIAIEMLQRKLREASFDDIQVDFSAQPHPTIDIALGGSTATFKSTVDAGGTSFVYTMGGQTTVIAADILRDFDVLDLTVTGITVLLSLQGPVRPDGSVMERVDFDATIHFRN